jgi:hypothetical protein
VPFFQILSATDEPLLFRKTVKCIIERILHEAKPRADASGAPALSGINLKYFAADVFAVASDTYVALHVTYAWG